MRALLLVLLIVATPRLNTERAYRENPPHTAFVTELFPCARRCRARVVRALLP
jgi:hypothetical protein